MSRPTYEAGVIERIRSAVAERTERVASTDTEAGRAWYMHWRGLVAEAEFRCGCEEPHAIHTMNGITPCRCSGVLDHAHCYRCGGVCETVSERMLREIRARDACGGIEQSVSLPVS